MSDEDQAQDSSANETSDSQSEATSETEGKEQSSDQQGGEQDKEDLFELPDGRKVDSKTLAKEWKENFYPEFTRRSQRLKELEKAGEEAKSGAEQQAREAVAENELLKNVDPSVREAIVKIVEPVIQQKIAGLEEKSAATERDKAFKVELDSLEKKYPGGDGRPKFDRTAILNKMREPSNRDFDPETVYQKLYQKELLDYQVKQALKQQKGGARLEKTGSEDSGKPQGKTPRTFEEAANAARSRI